ncbi:DUF3231 family protein [Pseudogracilibacillus sp. SE30717A]|uniref:DUF3231 family protein n=1 Tax=Pseudogracilibacillus sp. SE30717A TaxID=3098293 RepID=UPI00300E36EC
MAKVERRPNLTSGEISFLWMSYQYETMSKQGITFFLQHVEDEQIKELLEQTLSLTTKRIDQMEDIFIEEDYSLPDGFTEKDVNLDAPRLFSDQLYLEYTLQTSKMELMVYNLAFFESVQPKVQDYFHEILADIHKLEIKSKKCSLEKGRYLISPSIPVPKTVEYVQRDSFLAGWFGEKRPLLGIEISQLIFHAKRNALGQAVVTAFSQVAKSKEVRRYFERGREISGKHFEVFSKILTEEYLPNAASLLTSEVTDSTETPFSDRLMMNFITVLISAGISAYGASMSLSARRDLGVMYSRLTADILQFSDDGAEILIKNSWMEQPPIAANRKDLAK